MNIAQRAEGKARPGLLTQSNRPLSSVNDEARTVECVFSTGDLITHWVKHNDIWQRLPTRLVLTPEACDMSRCQNGEAPVLDDHMSWGARSVLGNISDITIAQGAARATLRFSGADSVQDVWQKVSEGTLRNVSVGFRVLEQEIRLEQNEDGENFEVLYFTKWQPFEISMVAVGADSGAQTQSQDRPTQDELAMTAGVPFDPAEFTPQTHSQATPPPAADVASTPVSEETRMSGDTTQTAAQSAETTQTQTATGSGTAPSQEELKQAKVAERGRIAAIERTGKQLGVDEAFIQSAIEDEMTIEDFRAQAIEAFAQRGQEATSGIGGPRADVTADAQDRFRQGALQGVMARGGMEGGERNEFTGMTLSELARQSLTVANVSIPHNRTEMVGRAFTQSGAHGTSDFVNILSNLMGKAALKGWEEANETFESWTQDGILTDFKATKRVGLGLIESLPEVEEGGNYTYGTVGDRGENIALATYGRLLKITRQAIINDDLNLFTSLPSKMGRAAKHTIGNLVYAVLTSNPAMSDGTALFHEDHGNLAGTGSALSVSSLSAGRTAMRTQTESTTSKAALNIAPAYLIVPAALETAATQLMRSTVDPGVQKGHAMNPVSGMAEVVTEARLDASSATAWYLASGSAFDTIEVAYLDGVKEPYLEEKVGWTSDGAELKVRIDAGVAPLDYRTLYKDPGA